MQSTIFVPADSATYVPEKEGVGTFLGSFDVNSAIYVLYVGVLLFHPDFRALEATLRACAAPCSAEGEA